MTPCQRSDIEDLVDNDKIIFDKLKNEKNNVEVNNILIFYFSSRYFMTFLEIGKSQINWMLNYGSFKHIKSEYFYNIIMLANYFFLNHMICPKP